MPALTPEARQKGNRRSAIKRAERADDFVESVAILVLALKDRGMSDRQIARELDRQNIPPRRSAQWCHSQVQRILRRAEAAGGVSLLIGEEAKGPFTVGDLVNGLDDGTIPPETNYLLPGTKTWRPLDELAKLLRGLKLSARNRL